jgi:hypothetical protein
VECGPFTNSPHINLGQWDYDKEQSARERLKREQLTDPSKADWQITTKVRRCPECRPGRP